MKARRWARRTLGWRREDLVLGTRLAVVAVAAMLLARLLGLRSFYWAGISAIVVSTGRPGGSFITSLTRVGGTLIGLSCGLLSVILLGHSFLAAALAIPLTILLCRTFGLRAAIKVGALTTLFPISLVADLHGLQPTLSTSLSRAGNVLLGCLVTMVLDGMLWPERLSRKLLKELRLEIGRAGSLAADLLDAYREGRSLDPGPRLEVLKHARIDHLALLDKQMDEPDDARAPKDWLTRQVHGVHDLVDHGLALRAVLAGQDGEGRVQALVQAELAELADLIRSAGQALEAGRPETLAVATLAESRARLEATYEQVRKDGATLLHPASDVFRLLGVLHMAGAIAEDLAALAEDRPDAPEAA